MHDVQRAVRLARGRAIEDAAEAALAQEGNSPGLVVSSIGDLVERGVEVSVGSIGAVTSVGELSELSNEDLPLVLARVRNALDPNGKLWFVDHGGCTTGILGAVARIHCGPLTSGIFCGRSLPELIRHAGFIITDIERFAMPTRNLLLRPWVQGVAVISSRRNESQI